MQAHADVVKKGYLKYKASKIKGKNAATTPGPKTSYKELFTVFRAPSGAKKIIDFYQTDRKYMECSQPKWSVDISSTVCVNAFDSNKLCFCLELECGGACLFEAKNYSEAEEWMACFNAVLFTKGTNGEAGLYYQVDLYESEKLHYHGPAFLELAEGSLIVWTLGTQEEVVRWKLSHIRSFKAKKTVLTIFTGSRSATGVGEFYFNSPLSVQITHAIETLVAKLKTKKSQSQAASRAPPPPSGPRPLPPAPQQGSPDDSCMPGLIENRTAGERMRPSISDQIPPHELYEDPDKPSLAIRPSQLPPHELYEDPDKPSLSIRPNQLAPHELYEDPDKPSLAVRPTQLPHRLNPQSSRRGGYEDIDGDLLPNNEVKSSPPVQAGREEPQISGAVYAQVDMSKKKRAVAATPPPPIEPYGQLQHFESQVSTVPDEYRKLEHGTRPSPPGVEEYGRLEHAAMMKPVEFQPEEYGKLDHGAKEKSPPYPSEYGRLDNSVGSPQSHPAEYGKLNSFDPYATLRMEQQTVKTENIPQTQKFPGYEMMGDVEEDPGIYSEIDDRKPVAKNRPPPGYENNVLRETPAERASFKQSSSPPTSRSRHSYVNVPNDGLATPAAPPIVPRRAQGKSEQDVKSEENKPKPRTAPKPKVSPKPKKSAQEQ